MGQEVTGPGLTRQTEKDEEENRENPSKPEMHRHTLAPVRRRRRARLLAPPAYLAGSFEIILS